MLDMPARVWPSAMTDIEDWVARIEANVPRVVASASDFEWVIATDASLWGWGYMAFNTTTGQTCSYGAPWNADARAQLGSLLGRSTFAEPRAVVNSLCHWRTPARASVKSVFVLSDNSATVSAFNRGFSTASLVLNQQIARLQRTFPELNIKLQHLAGELNPADGPSRGVPLDAAQQRDAAALLLQVVGSSPSDISFVNTPLARAITTI